MTIPRWGGISPYKEKRRKREKREKIFLLLHLVLKRLDFYNIVSTGEGNISNSSSERKKNQEGPRVFFHELGIRKKKKKTAHQEGEGKRGDFSSPPRRDD